MCYNDIKSKYLSNNHNNEKQKYYSNFINKNISKILK
jgi:hypothetical protein